MGLDGDSRICRLYSHARSKQFVNNKEEGKPEKEVVLSAVDEVTLSLHLQSYLAITSQGVPVLGGSLLHLVGSIGAEAWGCVEWYDEVREKPIEAYGWMRRNKVGEEDWLMLKRYHGSLLRRSWVMGRV